MVHVLLAGGACAGKTTTAALVVDVLRDAGVRTMVVGELASELMSSSFEDLGSLAQEESDRVQAAMAAAMVMRWHAAELLLSAAGGGVVVHDRGPLDAYAYSTRKLVDAALGSVAMSPAAVPSMYDIVYGFEQGPLESASNENRYEELALAASRGREVLAVWSTHPGFERVEWKRSVAVKAVMVAGKALELVSQPPTPKLAGVPLLHATPAMAG